MIIKKIFYFVNCFVLLIIISFVNQLVAVNQLIGEKPLTAGIIQPARYVSKNAGYSIQFPPTWEIVTGAMGTDVIALAPASDPSDLFRKSVNVIFAKISQNLTREEYYSFNLNSLERLLSDFDLEENHEAMIGGVEAREVIFTHTMGVVNVKVMQYLVLSKGKGYVITFTANRADFEKYFKTFKQIAESLRLE